MKPFSLLFCLMSLLGCKAADFRSVDADTFAQVIEDTTVVRLDVRTANLQLVFSALLTVAFVAAKYLFV